MGKRFTVMIVPERSSRVRRFRVSRATLFGLLILAVLMVAGSAVSAWYYFDVRGQLKENIRLRQENVEIKNQLVVVHEKVASVQMVLDRVQRYDTKLRAITELHDPKRHLALGPFDARQETSPDESGGVDPVARAIGEQPQQAAAKLNVDLDKLSVEAEKREASIRQLETYLRGQKARLTSTPSIWPTHGWVTSRFGMRVDPYTSKPTMHSGLDIANQAGVGVAATAKGVVTYQGTSGEGYGKVVVIDHGYGIRTRFGHLAESVVKVGDHIERGDPIGKIGNSGRSTGPHLHYEVEVNGVCEDPSVYILDE